MKHVIHVHQQKIKQGVVQSDEPDSCGARVWIKAKKTRYEVGA